MGLVANWNPSVLFASVQTKNSSPRHSSYRSWFKCQKYKTNVISCLISGLHRQFPNDKPHHHVSGPAEFLSLEWAFSFSPIWLKPPKGRPISCLRGTAGNNTRGKPEVCTGKKELVLAGSPSICGNYSPAIILMCSTKHREKSRIRISLVCLTLVST